MLDGRLGHAAACRAREEGLLDRRGLAVEVVVLEGECRPELGRDGSWRSPRCAGDRAVAGDVGDPDADRGVGVAEDGAESDQRGVVGIGGLVCELGCARDGVSPLVGAALAVCERVVAGDERPADGRAAAVQVGEGGLGSRDLFRRRGAGCGERAKRVGEVLVRSVGVIGESSIGPFAGIDPRLGDESAVSRVQAGCERAAATQLLRAAGREPRVVRAGSIGDRGQVWLWLGRRAAPAVQELVDRAAVVWARLD